MEQDFCFLKYKEGGKRGDAVCVEEGFYILFLLKVGYLLLKEELGSWISNFLNIEIQKVKNKNWQIFFLCII